MPWRCRGSGGIAPPFMFSALDGGEKYHLLGYITPCSPLKVNWHFGGTSPKSLVSCSAYSPTQKVEAICSSATSIVFQRTTRRYITEDGTLHSHCCENLKSYIDGSELSASGPGHFISGETALVTHWIGAWVDPRAGLDTRVETNHWPLQGIEPRPSAHSS
jgi:hypothetical protein